MKRLLSITFLCVLLALTMTACGGGSAHGDSGNESESHGETGAAIPDGTYCYGEILIIFSGNTMTTSVQGQEAEGTYEIIDGKLHLTGGDGATTELEYSLDGDKLTLGGAEYTKQ